MSARVTEAYKRANGGLNEPSDAQQKRKEEVEGKSGEIVDDTTHGKRRLPSEGDSCPVSISLLPKKACAVPQVILNMVYYRFAMKTLNLDRLKVSSFARTLAAVLCTSSAFNSGLLLLVALSRASTVERPGQMPPQAPQQLLVTLSLTKSVSEVNTPNRMD